MIRDHSMLAVIPPYLLAPFVSDVGVTGILGAPVVDDGAVGVVVVGAAAGVGGGAGVTGTGNGDGMGRYDASVSSQ